MYSKENLIGAIIDCDWEKNCSDKVHRIVKIFNVSPPRQKLEQPETWHIVQKLAGMLMEQWQKLRKLQK